MVGSTMVRHVKEGWVTHLLLENSQLNRKRRPSILTKVYGVKRVKGGKDTETQKCQKYLRD